MGMALIQIRVYRSGPQKGESNSTFSSYSFPYNRDETVLDLLMKAGSEDKGLVFRHSCHHGSCGTCGCMINGRERLACRASISEFSENSVITLEPLRGFRLLKDLLVDPRPLFSPIGDAWPYLKSTPQEGLQFENCIECGLCMSACPVQERFQGPAPLALLHRRMEAIEGSPSSASEQAELLEQAAAKDGVRACQRHVECSKVCPQQVSPARRIQDLRRQLGPEE